MSITQLPAAFKGTDTKSIIFANDEIKLIANVFGKSTFAANVAAIGGSLVEIFTEAAESAGNQNVTLELSHDQIALTNELLSKALFHGSILDCAQRCCVLINSNLEAFYKPPN